MSVFLHSVCASSVRCCSLLNVCAKQLRVFGLPGVVAQKCICSDDFSLIVRLGLKVMLTEHSFTVQSLAEFSRVGKHVCLPLLLF